MIIIARKKSGSFNQLDYIKEFNKKTYKRYIVQIRNERVDLINWIDQQPSKNAYIIDLIEKDMNRCK